MSWIKKALEKNAHISMDAIIKSLTKEHFVKGTKCDKCKNDAIGYYYIFKPDYYERQREDHTMFQKLSKIAYCETCGIGRFDKSFLINTNNEFSTNDTVELQYDTEIVIFCGTNNRIIRKNELALSFELKEISNIYRLFEGGIIDEAKRKGEKERDTMKRKLILKKYNNAINRDIFIKFEEKQQNKKFQEVFNLLNMGRLTKESCLSWLPLDIFKELLDFVFDFTKNNLTYESFFDKEIRTTMKLKKYGDNFKFGFRDRTRDEKISNAVVLSHYSMLRTPSYEKEKKFIDDFKKIEINEESIMIVYDSKTKLPCFKKGNRIFDSAEKFFKYLFTEFHDELLSAKNKYKYIVVSNCEQYDKFHCPIKKITKRIAPSRNAIKQRYFIEYNKKLSEKKDSKVTKLEAMNKEYVVKNEYFEDSTNCFIFHATIFENYHVDIKVVKDNNSRSISQMNDMSYEDFIATSKASNLNSDKSFETLIFYFKGYGTKDYIFFKGIPIHKKRILLDIFGEEAYNKSKLENKKYAVVFICDLVYANIDTSILNRDKDLTTENEINFFQISNAVYDPEDVGIFTTIFFDIYYNGTTRNFDVIAKICENKIKSKLDYVDKKFSQFHYETNLSRNDNSNSEWRLRDLYLPISYNMYQ
jgi:hypothetical protein